MLAKGTFHNEREETASVDELRSIQAQRLCSTFRHVYDKNTGQRARFREAGIHPEDFRGLDDLERVPFMTKENFRANYPLGLSCVEKRGIVEMHMSSGSTGTPIVMPYTEGDLQQWTLCMARCLRMAGAEPADVIQITPSFGLLALVGYGTSFGGVTALLSMLNTCSPGVAVVNIDNGFGAAALAFKMVKWLKR